MKLFENIIKPYFEHKKRENYYVIETLENYCSHIQKEDIFLHKMAFLKFEIFSREKTS